MKKSKRWNCRRCGMPRDSKGAWNCIHVKLSEVLFNIHDRALDVGSRSKYHDFSF